ncbi:MAG: hypothetical protein JW840_05645 [Candidatus Thermoplasmatota archaeon]|nr:hypothetical protein [Candidatus Thermoplasmatota archaeon]
MLVRRRKDHVLKKKGLSEGAAGENTVQSLRSWIRKIEQTTGSVSSRLTAVERRLSGGMTEFDEKHPIPLQGPIETLFMDGKKKNTGELARVLDRELSVLHNQVAEQQQQTSDLREHLGAIEQKNTTISHDLQVVQTTTSKMNATLEQRLKHTEQHHSLVMRVGAVEIPIEFTGIIGGLLAFTIAILVLLGQKEILLSPIFLFLVGLVFLTFALVKMVRLRSQVAVHPFRNIPIQPQAVQVNSLPSERKGG